jgi:hypothetical protein
MENLFEWFLNIVPLEIAGWILPDTALRGYQKRPSHGHSSALFQHFPVSAMLWLDISVQVAGKP